VKWRAASSPTDRPAWVEPVNDTALTSRWATIAEPSSPPPGSTCSTPAGSPASSNTRASTTPPDTEVRGSGLRITALPNANAGATERIASFNGMLNGAMTATTPTGVRRLILNCARSVGSTSPSACDGNSQDSRHSCTAPYTSYCAFKPMPPASRISQLCTSAACWVHNSAARRITAARSVNDTAAQSAWALPAEATERSRSPSEASPTRPISTPVAGSITAIVPPSGAVHSPSKIFPLHRASSRKFISLLHSLY
jgi:hypothetical protein